MGDRNHTDLIPYRRCSTPHKNSIVTTEDEDFLPFSDQIGNPSVLTYMPKE